MTSNAHTLLALCRQLLDSDAQPVRIHPGHNGTSVLRAATNVGEVIVKIHRDRHRHDQEVHAYQSWTPSLGRRAPQLLAVSDHPAAIITAALPGQILAEYQLDPSAEAAAHEHAGTLLRDLHRAGPPRMEPDMASWLAQRGEHWLALARDILPSHDRADIRAHLSALTGLGPLPAVPCHNDYTPRNLIVTVNGQIAVFDFEHARYDLPARDLVRLATRTWPARPDLKHALLHGYGPLSDLDNEVIHHCRYLDELTAVVSAAYDLGVNSGVLM